jgi:hypothetical protein
MSLQVSYVKRYHPRVVTEAGRVDARKKRLLFSPKEIALRDVVVDISRGGFRFISSGGVDVKEADVLELEIEHPAMSAPLQLRGRVRWVRAETRAEAESRGVAADQLAEEGSQSVGIEFLAPDEAVACLIEKIIEAELGSQILAGPVLVGYVAIVGSVVPGALPRYRVYSHDHGLLGLIEDEGAWFRTGRAIKGDMKYFSHEAFEETVRWLLGKSDEKLIFVPEVVRRR